jgi:hydrogenase expression/formation protein HypD
MSNPRAQLAAINALPLPERVRILHLSGDQERAISQSQLRQLLPAQVELVSGPGCPATLCPAEDIYQAIRLAIEHPVTLLTDESLLSMPGPFGIDGPASLAEARAVGADVRTVAAPVEAVMQARKMPDRDIVLFLAGFENLLAPLAGLLLEGFPDNLSLLLSGQRVESLFDGDRGQSPVNFDGLLLPGNHCALSGVTRWERIAANIQRPAVVAGYSASGLLVALTALLQKVVGGSAEVVNRFQSVARADGNAMARQRLAQVFKTVDGRLRGRNREPSSRYRLRSTFADHDAEVRYPDYRPLVGEAAEFAPGCACHKVAYGGLVPTACSAFRDSCRPTSPIGPCMASVDGVCRIQINAGSAPLRAVVAH